MASGSKPAEAVSADEASFLQLVQGPGSVQRGVPLLASAKAVCGGAKVGLQAALPGPQAACGDGHHELR
eukprot:8427404-Pyramimonas_sp.AAC.1